MSQDMMNILQQYVKELQKLYGSGLSAVILYGSYARGDFRADTDIDIMILGDMTDEEISQRGHVLSDLTFEYNFDHELSLVFDTPKGLVICNSCSHAGLESIVDNIKKRLNKPVYAYDGGLHMKSTKNHIETSSFTEEQIQNLCIFIEKNIQYVLTGHCTGNVSYDLLKKYLKDRIDFLTTGKTIEI